MFPGFYCIPEGGNNEEGVRGAQEIMKITGDEFDRIVIACGTGTTLGGIIRGLPQYKSALGISVLKNADVIRQNIVSWLTEDQQEKIDINADYHFGGYAKTTVELLQFVERFNSENDFKIEPVYTGKLFFALHDLILKKRIGTGERIMAVHTGGLQYLSSQ
jgi:1-aminocyclopropane-1-carboxylate deaminase